MRIALQSTSHSNRASHGSGENRGKVGSSRKKTDSRSFEKDISKGGFIRRITRRNGNSRKKEQKIRRPVRGKGQSL